MQAELENDFLKEINSYLTTITDSFNLLLKLKKECKNVLEEKSKKGEDLDINLAQR